jgi:hypothetical protein
MSVHPLVHRLAIGPDHDHSRRAQLAVDVVVAVDRVEQLLVRRAAVGLVDRAQLLGRLGAGLADLDRHQFVRAIAAQHRDRERAGLARTRAQVKIARRKPSTSESGGLPSSSAIATRTSGTLRSLARCSASRRSRSKARPQRGRAFRSGRMPQRARRTRARQPSSAVAWRGVSSRTGSLRKRVVLAHARATGRTSLRARVCALPKVQPRATRP